MATIVLVHGAGTGGWLWNAVVPRLEQHGHRALAPTLVGVGDRLAEGGPDISLTIHVDEVCQMLENEPAVLVGFSYGGAVVADRMPDRVRQLVFVDAFLPVPGRSMFDLMPADLVTRMRGAAEAVGQGWRLPPVPLEQLGDLGDVEPGVDRGSVIALLEERRGPHPIGTYAEAAAPPNPVAASIARTFVTCTQKAPGDPTLAMASMARSAGWSIVELATGHFAMLTLPTRLAAVLDKVAALGDGGAADG